MVKTLAQCSETLHCECKPLAHAKQHVRNSTEADKGFNSHLVDVRDHLSGITSAQASHLQC